MAKDHTSQKNLIRQLLAKRPYWGPQSVARELGIPAHNVRVVASREGITFMDRYQVEAYVDQLLDVIERLEAPESHGEAE